MPPKSTEPTKFLHPYILRKNDKLLVTHIGLSRDDLLVLADLDSQPIENHPEFAAKCPKRSTIKEEGHRILNVPLTTALKAKYLTGEGKLMFNGKELVPEGDQSSLNLTKNGQ